MHVNGIDPGFANDVLPLAMTSLSQRIDEVQAHGKQARNRSLGHIEGGEFKLRSADTISRQDGRNAEPLPGRRGLSARRVAAENALPQCVRPGPVPHVFADGMDGQVNEGGEQFRRRLAYRLQLAGKALAVPVVIAPAVVQKAFQRSHDHFLRRRRHHGLRCGDPDRPTRDRCGVRSAGFPAAMVPIFRARFPRIAEPSLDFVGVRHSG